MKGTRLSAMPPCVRNAWPPRGSLLMAGFVAGGLGDEPHHGFGCGGGIAIDPHEAAKRSVMRDKIVGDGADDLGCALSELQIKRVLEPHHLGRAVGVGFVAHAMICDHTNYGAKL